MDFEKGILSRGLRFYAILIEYALCHRIFLFASNVRSASHITTTHVETSKGRTGIS